MRTQKFQDLEEERLDFMKSSLWTFANIASTVCVSDDAVGCVITSERTALTLSSLARRSGYPSKAAKSRKTSQPLYNIKAQARRSPTHQNISTFAEAISMTQHQKYQKRRTTL